MSLLSIITPCFNEEESVAAFHAEVSRVVATMPGVDVEFIFVDDGSSDGTLSAVKRLREHDARVRFVSFSRNFGKEAAILAGLRYAAGDFVTLMDADLQDPPSLLPQMYASVASGEWDCAAARRTTRTGESPVRSWFARRFYRTFNAVSKVELVDGARDFRLMTRQVTDAVLELTEVNRFSKGILSWVGFRTTWIPFENVERAAGTTKWSLFGLMRYAIDGIVDFSPAPLAIASTVGLLSCVAALVGIVVIIGKTLIWGDPVAGWPSLACIVLLVGGMQLFASGVLGEYLSRTYLEAKHRPMYIARETDGPAS
jgi:glycosyltransferase involved in cell wall biosynthesis